MKRDERTGIKNSNCKIQISKEVCKINNKKQGEFNSTNVVPIIEINVFCEKKKLYDLGKVLNQDITIKASSNFEEELI